MALLELKNLKTFFATKRGTVKAVNGVSYSLDAGKVLGVVGESGSGKSVSAMSILRLLDGNGYIDSGEILFDGVDLTKLSMNEMYKIRGNEISVIFQEPMTSLNPVFTVSRQISEPLMIHQGMTKKQAAAKAVELLSDVKIPNPEVVAKQYPHQLSGGMRQRVMIAMALACRPKLLIADEPTTALDVTIQAQILQAHERAAGEKRHRRAVHHARSWRHQPDGRQRRGHVLRPGRRIRARGDHLPQERVFPSLYRGPDALHPASGHPQRRTARSDPRRGPAPAGSAQGLQIRPALQVRDRSAARRKSRS